MRRFNVLLLLACLLLALAQPVQAAPHQERRVALVIGNGAYKAAPLKNPVNDAKDIAAALKRLGFDVTLLTNAGQQEMDAAVREFGLKLRQGGAGLFYYAGHGLQVGGENYLVPVNANIQTESDVRFTCLPAGMVLGKMEDARNDLNIIILDACRNNPFARSFRSAEKGLATMDAPTGSLISYATAPGSVASDGAGKNGLFTQHLLKNMATPGLPITEVFMRVRQGVVAETKRQQVPWEASSLIGQFYFSGSAGDKPPPAVVHAAPAKAIDLKAEKQRVAEETARLKREQEELAQFQALQAEKDRLEGERLKLEQAKLLALAPRPKQPLPTASSVAAQVGVSPVDVKHALAGRYALAWRDEGPSEIVIDFAVRGGELTATTSGSSGATRAVSITGLTLRKNRLSFRFNYKRGALGLGGAASDTYTCDVSGDLEVIPATYSSDGGSGKARLIRQSALQPLAAGVVQTNGHAAQFAALARSGLPDARAYFEQAVQARPADADARAGLAIALVFSGREADAKYQVQRLNESGLQTAGVRLAKGLMLGLEGSADASYQFNRALEEGADRALVLLCQAAAAAKRNEYEKGQNLLRAYGEIVSEPERGERYAAFSKRLNVLDALVGTYRWLAAESMSTRIIDMNLTFSRQGTSLVGAGGGRWGWGTMDTVKAFDFHIEAGKLVFVVDMNRAIIPAVYHLTCDISGGLDTIPVTLVEELIDGRKSIEKDYSNSKLIRVAPVTPK